MSIHRERSQRGSLQEKKVSAFMKTGSSPAEERGKALFPTGSQGTSTKGKKSRPRPKGEDQLKESLQTARARHPVVDKDLRQGKSLRERGERFLAARGYVRQNACP